MEPPRSYLFLTWEGGGNVPPVLGAARRLVDRGHDVRVLTEPCLEEAVLGVGARFIPFTRHFVRRDRAEDIMGDWQAKTPLGAVRRSMDRVLFGPAHIVAEETSWALQRERPDVVVADLMMPGALVAAEAAGIPRVVLFHMPEYLPGPGRPAAGPGFLPREDLLGRLRDGLLTRLLLRSVARYIPSLNETRRAFGLAPFAGPGDVLGMFHSADLRLIQTSEAFDFPIKPAPPNVRYVGPVLDEPDWAGEWQDPWPPDDRRPLVVVGFSTTFQNQVKAISQVIRAVERLDVRALVTLGPALREADLREPANVKLVAAAPHGQVFPHAAAVVTHGGHGTVMRALYHGLPLLCLPMGRDQDDNAAKIVARGAGLRLKSGASPGRIAAALQTLLNDPSYRSKADALRRAIEADVHEDRAVRLLEQVGHRPILQPA